MINQLIRITEDIMKDRVGDMVVAGMKYTKKIKNLQKIRYKLYKTVIEIDNLCFNNLLNELVLAIYDIDNSEIYEALKKTEVFNMFNIETIDKLDSIYKSININNIKQNKELRIKDVTICYDIFIFEDVIIKLIEQKGYSLSKGDVMNILYSCKCIENNTIKQFLYLILNNFTHIKINDGFPILLDDVKSIIKENDKRLFIMDNYIMNEITGITVKKKISYKQIISLINKSIMKKIR